MKISLKEIDTEKFYVREVQIAGETCYLVTPKKGFFDWTEDVLHFRSSLWNSDGELISAGFKKFFNLEEKPAINPLTSFDNVNVIEKLDDSCLIVSRYKNETIIRTRGTVDARQMPNGDEIDYLKSKYKKFFDFVESDALLGDKGTKNHSYLFEWISPRNKIVIDYGEEPDIKLIGIVEHSTYTLAHQFILDVFAENLELKRPAKFKFESQLELITAVKDFTGKEGVCIYYDNDQHIRKVKSLLYLKLHAFKSDLTVRRLAEILFENQKVLSYDPLPCEKVRKEFEEYIAKTFDHECLVQSKTILDDLFNRLNTWYNDLQMIGLFVVENKELTQKDFALKLIDKVKGKSYLANFGFMIRSGTFNPSVHKKKFVDMLKCV